MNKNNKVIKYSGLTLAKRNKSNCCKSEIGIVWQEIDDFKNGFVCLKCGKGCTIDGKTLNINIKK